jgi:hypothetical protein
MKPSVMADTIGVAILATVTTLPLACVPTLPPPREDLQPFVAVAGSYSLLNPELKPVPPQSGCDTGCKCGGTGLEKSGDGLANVSCRCPETCPCKAKKSTASVGWPIRNMDR